MIKFRRFPLVLALTSALCFLNAEAEVNSLSRTINIMNESGRKVEIYWVHPQTNELHLQSNPHVFHGATFQLNSFVDHAFEVRELPSKRTGECGEPDSGDNTCRTGYFVVNQNDNQVFKVGKAMEVVHEDNEIIARESAAQLIGNCQEGALHALNSKALSPTQAIESLVDCVEQSVSQQMIEANEEIAFQTSVRKSMGELFEDYTCADHDLPTTAAKETDLWVHNNQRYNVEILHNRPASKIHLIKNFISPAQCEAMEKTAAPQLHSATVADGKGGSELSPNRKALQAGIKIPWDLESKGDHLAEISRKVYDYTEYVLGMGIDEHGQEDLMSIQYVGRGDDDKEPDRYMPHCDGDCNGLDFKTGNRMATVVMYCTVPERGGATNFRNSGVHIVPEPGSATFFSYIDPDTMKMDSGFTEHSGCPVLEGEKKIVTQWIRHGVDVNNPWDSFNTLGIKHSEAEDQ